MGRTPRKGLLPVNTTITPTAIPMTITDIMIIITMIMTMGILIPMDSTMPRSVT
jgi:hypothetical protein